MRCLVAFVAVLGLVSSSAPGNATRPEQRGTASWRGLSVPFVRVPDDPKHQFERVAVSFRGTKVPFSEFPDGINAITASADSAVVAAVDWSKDEFEGPLLEVAADGTTGTVEKHAVGIPLADPLGHHVFWTAKRRGGARLIAYDTRTHTRIRGPVVGPGRVFAVDGDEAFVARAIFEGPGAASWTVGDADLTAMVLPSTDEEGTAVIGDVAGDMVLSTDYRRTVISDRQGTVQTRLPDRFWGTFSPDVRYIASGGFQSSIRVWDLDAAEEIGLRGLGRWRPNNFHWSPTGALVVTAERRGLSYDDVNPARRFVCRLPSGRCDRLPGRSALFFEPVVPSSALGQYITVLPYS